MITNTMLSLKQPGEDYTVIRNKFESTVLGKQEVEFLSDLAIHDEDAGFEFPLLSDETLSKTFENMSEVGVQVNAGKQTFSFSSIKTYMSVFEQYGITLHSNCS